jgi:hypothetical protein
METPWVSGLIITAPAEVIASVVATRIAAMRQKRQNAD